MRLPLRDSIREPEPTRRIRQAMSVSRQSFPFGQAILLASANHHKLCSSRRPSISEVGPQMTAWDDNRKRRVGGSGASGA